jgi:hypothetical protein
MKTPARDAVTPTTPLRLEVAAELGFPDGSMTTGALRRLAAAQKLDHEKISGRYYVTLAAIEEMRERCRVKAKAPAPRTEGAKAINSYEADGSLALAALRAKAEQLKESLRPASSKKPADDPRGSLAVNAAKALAEELKEKLRPVPATRPKLRRRF